MKKFYLVLLFFILSLTSFAQENNFYISNTYFEGQKVKFFSENRGGAVVVLDDLSIYVMNKNLEFTEVTGLFEAEILQDISCIEVVNERLFLLGTMNNSLFMYQEGKVTLLKDQNPDMPLQINSISFEGNDYGKQVLLATSDNMWVSNDFKTFSKSEWMYTNNTKFYSGRTTALLTDYPYCTSVQGEFGLQYTYWGNTLLFRLFENEGFDINKLNDVIYAKRGYGGSTYNTYAYYGTNNGIYTQHLYNCGKDTVVHFENTEVHDLEIISSGLTKSALFAASDSGLLYMEATDANYFDVFDPQYFRLDGIDSAYSINYSLYHKSIWVGTNNGLLQVSDNQLTSETMGPGIVEFDTVNFCQDQGVFMSVSLHEQLDIEWYRNNQKIEGALSRAYSSQEEGLYSVKFTYKDQTYDFDVAYAQLDSTFNERISKKDYLLCADDTYRYIEIENFNYYSHNYSWYSLERGLEFETGNGQNYFYAEEGGHYYFIATNCNGFTYRSDTVQVIKSQLEQPYFSGDLSEQNFCTGDTLFVTGSDHAVSFSWSINYNQVENNNEPFIILEKDNAYDYLSVVTTDVYGCEFFIGTYLGNIMEPPSLSTDQLNVTICEPESFVNFNLPQGVSVIWEGYYDSTYHKVGPGIYPVIVTNGVCTEIEVNAQIDYFDPLSNLYLGDTTMMADDTLKIPSSDSYQLRWDWPFRESKDKSFIYITSSEPDTLQADIYITGSGCYKSYSFNIIFEKSTLLGINDDFSDINIYPNPATEGVMIGTNSSDIVNIQLVNVNGKIIIERPHKERENIYFKFPPELKSGVYLLRMFSSNHEFVTRKVIIN